MIGIIGAGNMGKAISSRIKQKIVISDASRAKIRFAAKNKHIIAAGNNITLAKRAAVIILAVKPQDIIKVLKEIRPYSKGKLIISIAAGVKTSLIEKLLGKSRVVRVMPNMPAVVGNGISAVALGRFATKKDADTARSIFLNLGQVVDIKETFMDAVTALSGSGPAYYFLFTDLLEKAGVSAGLRKDIARQLAKATFTGAAASAVYTDLSMQDLVRRVASKGGTTEAALKIFKDKGLERIIKEAVRAAAKRSCALSGSIKN